jgi:hypothetical protein
MIRKATQLLKAAGAMLFVLTAAIAVRADETYSFPALMCVEINDSAPELEYRGDGTNRLGAFNTNQSYWADYACPILRRAPDTGYIEDIRVTVDDENTGQNIECRVFSCNSGASFCNITGWYHATYGLQTIPLSADPPFSVLGRSNGPAWIECSVPDVQSGGYGPSGVISYFWTD